MNQFNIIKRFTQLYTQQQDTNSTQVPIDYKPEGTHAYPGNSLCFHFFHKNL